MFLAFEPPVNDIHFDSKLNSIAYIFGIMCCDAEELVKGHFRQMVVEEQT